VTTQVYRVYIKASPQAIWDAITKPEWTERGTATGPSRVRPASGGTYRGLTSEAMRSTGARTLPSMARSSRQTRRGG
jgi:uncharacterized protein YndB with AHSA1/START domain